MGKWLVMPWRRYGEFDARSTRREFWLFWVVCALVGLGIDLAFGQMSVARGPGFYHALLVPNATGQVLGGVFSLLALVPGLAVSARRLHDADRSAGWLALVLLPGLGWFVLLVFFCLDGTRGGNRYGADPRGRGL